MIRVMVTLPMSDRVFRPHCFADVQEMLSQYTQVRWIADELARLYPESAAAKATRRYVVALDTPALQLLIDLELQTVWEAVEGYVKGDWGLDEAEKAIAAYAKLPQATPPPRVTLSRDLADLHKAQGRLEYLIGILLTGLSQEDLLALGGVRFVSSSDGKVLGEWL